MSEEKAIATKSNIKHQRQITYNVFLAVYLFYDSSVRFGLTLSIEFVTLDFASKVFALHVHKKRVCCLLTVYALAKKRHIQHRVCKERFTYTDETSDFFFLFIGV